jgi:ABC-type glycerol-3-phosphate transport system substrate-binding protein
MKTNLKRMVAMLLMVALVVTVTIPMTGCSGKVANDENTLEIYATNSGYGIKWIEELIPIFEEQNPGIKVVFKYDTGVELARQKVLAGPGANTADLMFTAEDWNTIVLQGDKAAAGYDYAIEDLTEFLNEKDENGVALRDKFLPYYLEANAIEIQMDDGEYEYRDFVLPWHSSYHGIVYNKTMFENNGWELPNTTDELLALTDEIKAAGVTPLVNETLTGYIGNQECQLILAQQIEVIEVAAHFLCRIHGGVNAKFLPVRIGGENGWQSRVLDLLCKLQFLVNACRCLGNVML